VKNVLVTGGTGFIGVELMRLLTASGLRPRVLVRRPHRAALLNAFDVELVQGDLAVPSSLDRALRGIDTVFHLGGRASFESYRRLRPTIVGGTVELGRRAAGAGVEHFVFASSLFVYGDQVRPIDATTPPDPVLGYGRAKLEAEGELAKTAASSGMGVASLRLPHVYGPQSILFKQVRGGVAIFPGRMANGCGQLHVTDAARILAAVGEARWTGSSAVADDEIVTWSQYFEVLRTLYPYFRLISLPRWLALAGAFGLEPLLSRRNRPTLYTKDTVIGFNLEVPVQPGLVWRDVGVAPRYPSIHEGIPAALDGYVQYRWRHPLLDHRRD
jgi:nucleoside-diphosphate-sugar epimerase